MEANLIYNLNIGVEIKMVQMRFNLIKKVTGFETQFTSIFLCKICLSKRAKKIGQIIIAGSYLSNATSC